MPVHHELPPAGSGQAVAGAWSERPDRSRHVGGTGGGGRARAGRPLDTDLTAVLVGVTLDLLAEVGVRGVNADVIAHRASAGKAALYRRWPSVPVLVSYAVTTCTLVVPPRRTGTLRADLAGLLQPFTRPLTRGERAAAALLGEVGHDELMRTTLDRAMFFPLTAAVHQITMQHRHRDSTGLPGSEQLLDRAVRSLWCDRYVRQPDAMTSTELAELVDTVLAPVATGDR